MEDQSLTDVGFTGTQRGMTPAQEAGVERLLRGLSPERVHHGDCIGADAEFHHLATNAGMWIVVHPPENQAKQALCRGDEARPQKSYLARNHDIVDESEMLIAAPSGPEELRSGTWATVRYARKVGKPVLVVTPDGELHD